MFQEIDMSHPRWVAIMSAEPNTTFPLFPAVMFLDLISLNTTGLVASVDAGLNGYSGSAVPTRGLECVKGSPPWSPTVKLSFARRRRDRDRSTAIWWWCGITNTRSAATLRLHQALVPSPRRTWFTEPSVSSLASRELSVISAWNPSKE